jgi:hypothetical protein
LKAKKRFGPFNLGSRSWDDFSLNGQEIYCLPLIFLKNKKRAGDALPTVANNVPPISAWNLAAMVAKK